jgi:hypothetical protein
MKKNLHIDVAGCRCKANKTLTKILTYKDCKLIDVNKIEHAIFKIK